MKVKLPKGKPPQQKPRVKVKLPKGKPPQQKPRVKVKLPRKAVVLEQRLRLLKTLVKVSPPRARLLPKMLERKRVAKMLVGVRSLRGPLKVLARTRVPTAPMAR